MTGSVDDGVRAELLPSGEPPLMTRNFVVLMIAHFLQALGYASMLLLPIYLQYLQASRTQIGVVMAIAAVSGLAARPVIGWALDRLGRRPTLIAGTCFLVLSMEMLLLVDRIGPLLYATRIIFGIGIAALFSGYFAAAADIVPQARRTEGLALFGISGLLPMLVNPFTDQIGIAAPDLRWFLPIVGGVIFLSIVPLLILPESAGKRGEKLDLGELLRALRNRPLWPAWFATAVFSGLVAVFMTFATVAADRRGVARPATLWLSYAGGAIFVRALGARLPERIGPANLVAPALGSYVVALMLTASATSLTAFLVAALLAGLGHGYCFPVLSGQVVTRTPERFRGSAMALFTAIWGLTDLIASPLFGALADRWGDGGMFLFAAVTGIVSLAMWVLLEHKLAPRNS